MPKNKQDKSGESVEQLPCKYDIEFSSRQNVMVAKCKECDGEGGLTDQKCLMGMLNAVSKEFNIDSIILSHYIERLYEKDAVDVLRHMARLVKEFDRLSIRNPLKQYFSEKEIPAQRSKCQGCDMNPQNLFPEMRQQFIMNVENFYMVFLDRVRSIYSASKDPKCKQCLSTTNSDIVYLFDKLEDLREDIIYKAFKIKVKRGG
ncbi:MAG: hypothetical protein JSW28_03870 [Thermoplasmata archaeon]|nr:MAG: hypothetical protein JSW28_03870 [Thermoplasmata archaeon]